MEPGSPEACEGALRSLSAAPPDQWGEILSMLGASFHPAAGKKQLQESPFTVSSLLRGLGQTGPEQAHAPSPQQQPQQPQPLPEPQKASASGNRTRARRKQKSPTRPAEPIKVDTRDIEDLLRDLGEGSADTQSKKKGKAKEGSKSVEASKGSVASTASSSAARPHQKIVAPQAAVVSVASSAPGVASASVSATQAAVCDTDHGETDAGLWTVVSHASRAKPTQKLMPGSTTDEDLAKQEDFQSAEATSQQIGHCCGEPAAGVPPADSLEMPLVSGTSDPHVEDEPVASHGQRVVAFDAVAGHGSIESEVEDGELGQTSMMHRSLSEGDLPEVCHNASRVLGPDPESCVPAMPYFGGRPSVGTWLQHPMRPRRAQPLSEDPAMPVAARRSGGARSCSAELTKPKTDSRVFHANPSVATWLTARPQTPSPTSSATERLASLRLDLPKRSLSRDRSASKEPLQLWPATPTATPPDSPRFDRGQVVWLPVPVHLLPEVQALLCRNGVSPLGFAASP